MMLVLAFKVKLVLPSVSVPAATELPGARVKQDWQ